jgi:hypothetical protein
MIGFWILDFGFWILDFGFWILDFGFWILDFGFWILDCPHMNLEACNRFYSGDERMRIARVLFLKTKLICNP